MLGFPIPAELITGGASALLSAGLSLWSMHLKAKQEAYQQLIGKAKAQDDSYNQANKRGTRWTRRMIALAVVGAGFVWPLLAPLAGLQVTLGWTELHGGFWFFTDPKQHMVWHTVSTTSLVITPLVTHTVSAVIGFYFGGSVVEAHAR